MISPEIKDKIKHILQNVEFRAVQRHANLVDLEKCSKMSIWMQKSASIQPRTDKNKVGCGPTTDRGPCRYEPPQRGIFG